MARTQNGTATVETDGASIEGQITSGDATGPAPKARAARLYIVVPMPANMKDRFEADAKTADKPVGPYVRDFLAQTLGIEIPVTETTRRSKYASDVERKDAQAKRNADRSSTMKNLMAAYRNALKAGLDPSAAASQAAANVASGAPTEEPAETVAV